MATLASLRSRLQACKIPAAGQASRQFLPEGSLEELLSFAEITSALSDPAFQIPSYKLESTAQIILAESRKVFAILVDLRLEYALRLMIESDCLDSQLPLSERDLKDIVPEAAGDIVKKQWEYIAYTFRKGAYQRKIQNERILPFLQETKIGGGGFSIVYEVIIHPGHQNIVHYAPPSGVCLVRKEIRVINQGASNKDEAELLFLLGSLRHKNIVELLASYNQTGITNLLFPRADSDLHQFLFLPNRPPTFQDDATIFRSLQGLSSGLAYLHNFRLQSTSSNNDEAKSFHGYHHDIKPRNVLVRGADFILADFGLSRLKAEDEPTQTNWKDSTYEYGAPECRDPHTFRPGMVGRALDIWSLGCVFSEVMVYMKDGSQGIQKFRDCRLVDNFHGKTRSFHDNNALAVPVDRYMKSVEDDTTSTATRSLGTLIRSMFATEPEFRPKSREVEERMANVTLESFTLALSQIIEQCYDTLSKPGDAIIFRTRVGLEKTRLEAWAAVLGLITIHGKRRLYDKQTASIFSEVCAALDSAIKDLRDHPDFDNVESNQDFVISTLHHTNNKICGLLSNDLKLSVDSTFAILSTHTKSLELLHRIETTTQGGSTLFDDISAISAMKYMSILLQQQTPGSQIGKRIESTLVKEAPTRDDPEISPQTYWYAYGFRDHERTKALVEYKLFNSQWAKDPDSSTFEKLGEKVFHETEYLVNMLQREPKPPDFRVLKCLGAFPDIGNCRFGIVYGYPDENTTPIKLHSLFQRQKRRISPPGLSERLALATALVTSVHAFHISGWLHKNINSHNVLFFCQSLVPLVGLNFEGPYMVGFNHSRLNNANAYTDGPVNNTREDYQHPSYRNGDTRFRQEFDIYSLGLLLLEIGLWSSLEEIGKLYPELPPHALKEKYMYCCEKLDNMGRKYQAVTKICLQADIWFNNESESVDLRFQEKVVQTLRSCSI